MKIYRIFAMVALSTIILAACQAAGPSAEDIAATNVAKQAAEFTPTTPPTETPVPTETNTPLPPTNTPKPTNTATATATPGPFTYKDDFSEKKQSAWGAESKYDWKDGQFIVGPFEAGSNPGENLNYTVCYACGQRNYYRFAVDATFIDGQVDRFFGVLGPVTDLHVYYLGISPFQAYVVRHYDYEAHLLKGLASKGGASQVYPGKKTNRFEIQIKPTKKEFVADVVFMLNGKAIYTLYGWSVEPSYPGLGMSFHSVTVAYDNFEYEEYEVP